MIRAFDDLLLGIATIFAHWFQRLTGRTNFFIAKIFLTLAAVSDMTKAADAFMPSLLVREISHGMAVWIVIGLMFLFWMCKKCEEQEQNAVTQNVRSLDYWLTFGFGWRVYFLFHLGLTVYVLWGNYARGSYAQVGLQFMEIVSYMGSAAAVGFVYFVSVNPLPPQKSKIKEWIESFRSDLVLSPNEN